MCRLSSVLALILVRIYSTVEYDMDGRVFVLTDTNFDDFIQEHPNCLVEFYAPWCGHCKKLAPEYEKAATVLDAKAMELNFDVALAKVDATVETETAKRFDIKGYPTLKFWKDGSTIDYEGGREADGIVDWILQRLDPDYKPPPEFVVTLTSETFDEFIASNDLVLVEFYAPWCGHCKQLAPEFEKAAKILKAKAIKLAKVDATVEKSLGDRFGLSGYPTLKILRKGKSFDYNGPRDAAGISNYMIEQAKPAAQKMDSVKEIQRFMSKDDVTIIGFFATEESKLFESFFDAAESSREEFSTVAYTTDPLVIKHFIAKPNDILIYYPEIFNSKYEPKSAVFNEVSASSEDLIKFWRDNAIPLVGLRTQKNLGKRYGKYPLVVIYYAVDFSLAYRQGTQYWRNMVLDMIQPYKDKFRFAVSDEEECAKEMAEVGLGDSGLEQNVLAFGYDGKKYPMNPDKFDGEFDENFPAFMQELSQGRIKAYLKSAPAPKDDKGPVKTLVASNFAKIALDESKDALIEFYAPWCGHCKSFEPKYKQLATKLKSAEPNLILAKYDATVNDAPEYFDVSGFPTIYFAPSGKKDQPVKYEGNRDVDDLTKFMMEHAVKSFVKSKKEKKSEL